MPAEEPQSRVCLSCGHVHDVFERDPAFAGRWVYYQRRCDVCGCAKSGREYG